MKTVLLILGMRDNRSREQILEALEPVPGLQEVDVNLIRARATILHESSCSVADLVQAITRAGYDATRLED